MVKTRTDVPGERPQRSCSGSASSVMLLQGSETPLLLALHVFILQVLDLPLQAKQIITQKKHVQHIFSLFFSIFDLINCVIGSRTSGTQQFVGRQARKPC